MDQVFEYLGNYSLFRALITAWLMKILEEDSNDPDSPPKDVKINNASIEKIPDPVPPSGKRKGTPKLDFPLGL